MEGSVRAVELTWEGDMRFRGGEPGGPTTLIDADNATAPGPMLTLLLAAAACSGADVVSILGKMRVELGALRIEVEGRRQAQAPTRLRSIRFTFHVTGGAIDQAKVRRAVELSLQKYCSVVHSLAPDIAVEYELDLA
jgi:putative redox protein